MDLNEIRSAVTLFSLLLFLGLVAWTWWPTRRRALATAAMLPFEGEVNEPSTSTPATLQSAAAQGARS